MRGVLWGLSTLKKCDKTVLNRQNYQGFLYEKQYNLMYSFFKLLFDKTTNAAAAINASSSEHMFDLTNINVYKSAF